jgi:hypothetical protein
MNCRQAFSWAPALIVAALYALSCKEELPTYVAPQNVLALSVTTIEQLSDHVAPPEAQVVHLVLTGENVFDEVFMDSVDVKGTMTIWWKRKPDRSRTIYLTEKNMTDRSLIHNQRLMLVPGQTFSMDVDWDLRSDDDIYLPSEMDFLFARKRYCEHNVICSNPEVFVVEVSLNVYNRLGYLSAPPREFTFIGRMCVLSGYPPCAGTAQ